MSFLAKITSGKVKKPAFAVIYGPDGVGKSSFAAEAPGALFLGSEDGTSNLNVSRLPSMNRLSDVMGAIKELTVSEHKYKTLAIDSLDWLERQVIWPAVCEKDGSENIDKAQGGYGKGYNEANKVWDEMIAALMRLREAKGMNIIAIAHSQVKTFNDPTQIAPYDRYMLKLNDKAAAIWREAVEAVLFATFEVVTKKENKGDKKARAYGDGARVLFTERRPSFDAKNRYGLPFEMPLSWAEFQKGIDLGQPDSFEAIMSELVGITTTLADKEMSKRIATAIEKAGGDVASLVKIRNHARVVANA